MAPIACPVCSNPARPTNRFRTTPLQECQRCGLLFRDSISEAEVLRMYSDDSYSAQRMDALTRHRELDARKRASWTRTHSSGSRLLEVGAGAGFFVKLAGEHGFEAIGIEPSDLSARYARCELGVDVRTGFLETSIPPSEAYDVVCMWHVLEHVPHPVQLLEQAHARLRRGGRLVLEVPNVESVGASIMKGRWAHLDPDAHVCHFGPDSLKGALERAGFEVLHLSTLVEGYYDPLATRMRPRRIAGRVVRGLRLRTLRLTHPRRGELLRAVADRGPT